MRQFNCSYFYSLIKEINLLIVRIQFENLQNGQAKWKVVQPAKGQ